MLDHSLLPLVGRRATLRPLLPDDAADYAEGVRDPAVREYAHLPEPYDTEEAARRMITEIAGPGLSRGDLGVLAIADAATGAFAGSLVLFDLTADGAEIGFWIHPRHRGEGLAVAALELAADLAGRSGLALLTARTMPENRASCAVLERAGFLATGDEHGTTPSGHETVLTGWRRSLHATPYLPRRTPRLLLRLHRGSDAAALHRFRSRPEVARFLLEEPWDQEEAARQIRDRLRSTGLESGTGRLAVAIEHEGRLIGEVTVWMTDAAHRVAEIGWVLDPELGGRGLAAEAVQAVLELAFEEYHLHRVTAQMDARNLASARLAERVGMRREGHLRQDWWSKGERTDTLVHGMLAEDSRPPGARR